MLTVIEGRDFGDRCLLCDGVLLWERDDGGSSPAISSRSGMWIAASCLKYRTIRRRIPKEKRPRPLPEALGITPVNVLPLREQGQKGCSMG